MKHRNFGSFLRVAPLVCAYSLITAPAAHSAEELVVGEARVKPGILFIFEAAVRDQVFPLAQNLAEDKTDIHFEGRANWDEKGIPEGAIPGSFVAYLNMNAEITNERTGQKVFTSLIPHVNLIDNLHYARNIALPGRKSDLYTVEVFVNPPDPFALATHKDWKDVHGNRLFKPRKFTFTKINFQKIVDAPPR